MYEDWIVEMRAILTDLAAEMFAEGVMAPCKCEAKARLAAVTELCEKWVERGGYDSKHALRDVLALARDEGGSDD
jgi:hypothetical protein